MLDTRFTRELLNNLVAECMKCAKVFYDNVALIVDDEGFLDDGQVEAVFICLHDNHVQYVH